MNNAHDPVLARYHFACEIARAAGQSTLRYFQTDDFRVERKGDDSPVTVADRDAEQLLRERIADRFPDDAILGEELGSTPGTSGFRWILDPIDGTKSFIHGVPLYTTLVAVEEVTGNEQGRSLAGVIYVPAADEIVHAATGRGAWYSKAGSAPQRAKVSSVTKLAESLLLTSEIATFSKRATDALGVFLDLQSRSRLVRTWGDAYGYMMIALGRAEVMIDPIMNLWDGAAIQPILEEAGGAFTDWQGNPTAYAGEGIGANAHVLAEVLAAVRGK